ncbi:MAG TPA: hypothetical protein VGB37_05355 [Candidatus Lokiarchaeia archaeon]
MSNKSLRKNLETIWKKIIKLRAGMKSELSGQIGILHAHHIVKKPCDFLRFDLDNGICLTAGEHNYGIHGKYEEDYREKIKAIRGSDIYEKLNMRRHNTCDLRLVEIYLKEELKKYKNDL